MKKILFLTVLMFILVPQFKTRAQCLSYCITDDPVINPQRTELHLSYHGVDNEKATYWLLYKVVKGGKRAFYSTPWKEGGKYTTSFPCEEHSEKIVIELNSLKSNEQVFWQARKINEQSIQCAGELKSFTNKGRPNFRTEYMDDDLPVEFSIYPNPANFQFSISDPSGEAATLVLRDLTGREVMNIDLSTESETREVPCSHIANGMYFYEVTFADEGILSGQLIINR